MAEFLSLSDLILNCRLGAQNRLAAASADTNHCVEVMFVFESSNSSVPHGEFMWCCGRWSMRRKNDFPSGANSNLTERRWQKRNQFSVVIAFCLFSKLSERDAKISSNSQLYKLELLIVLVMFVAADRVRYAHLRGPTIGQAAADRFIAKRFCAYERATLNQGSAPMRNPNSIIHSVSMMLASVRSSPAR